MVTLTVASCLSYIFSAGCQGLFLKQGHKSLSVLFRLSSLLALSLHGTLLYMLIETPAGQNLDHFILLSLIFWLLNITIFVCVPLTKIENLSLFTYPLTVLVLILSMSFGGKLIVQTKIYEGMVSHIFLSLLAMSMLFLACFQACLLGIQNYYLKHRTPSTLLRYLPPLQSMESLLFTFLWLSFFLLSFSLISGLWFHNHYPELKHDPRILLSFVTWIILVVLLMGRYLLGWRATKAVTGTAIGFLLMFLSYFGNAILG